MSSNLHSTNNITATLSRQRVMLHYTIVYRSCVYRVRYIVHTFTTNAYPICNIQKTSSQNI